MNENARAVATPKPPVIESELKTASVVPSEAEKRKAVAAHYSHAIIEDFFVEPSLFRGKRILEVDARSSHFLDVARLCGADTFGTHREIETLGNDEGHPSLAAEPRVAWPFPKAVFDGIMYRSGFNAYYFVKNPERLKKLLNAIAATVKPGGWLWMVPVNTPTPADVSRASDLYIQTWMTEWNIQASPLDVARRRRYGLNTSLEKLELWRFGV